LYLICFFYYILLNKNATKALFGGEGRGGKGRALRGVEERERDRN
jgi:hypothetical protein